MSSAKSTSNPRDSLRPPRGNTGSPNAAMVKASDVRINVINHIQQSDEKIAPKKEQQRLSLDNAFRQINMWNKIYASKAPSDIENNKDDCHSNIYDAEFSFISRKIYSNNINLC